MQKEFIPAVETQTHCYLQTDKKSGFSNKKYEEGRIVFRKQIPRYEEGKKIFGEQISRAGEGKTQDVLSIFIFALNAPGCLLENSPQERN
ncbi:MAG: hypothetical protein J6T94_02125 [Bacteroidaceae bacterium]|nr:hypothetical protein [Bacteroidaceae bacterium]